MPKIRAAVCHAFNQPLTVEEVMLAPPGPGEVEVTLEAVAICHSDISYAEGAWGGPLPAVYGHEAAGRITAVGPGTAAPPPGSRVIATLLRACGSCLCCSSGHPAHCERKAEPRPSPLSRLDGSPIAQGLYCGAFAERMVVPASQIAPVPEALPADQACLLACGVVTGVGAVLNTAEVKAGEIVVVIGAGGVGLNAIQGARIAGAARVVAVDMLPEKLEDARLFGATDTVLASVPKPWAEMRRRTGRAADVVLVAAGAAAAYADAPRYLAPLGRLIAVGMPPSGQTAAYEPVILAATGQQIRGSLMGDAVLARDIPRFTDLHAQGRLMLAELISRRWSLDQINEAIADTGAGNARRNVITF